MRAPVVGITVSLDPGERIRPGTEYLYVGRAYARAVAAAGGVPVLLAPDAAPADALRIADAIVLSGGGMLPTALAGPSALDLPEAPERVDWDRRLLDAALARGIPLLGVCYGMQLLNLHQGGTLCADLRLAVADALDHGGAGRVVRHEIAIEAGSWLAPALGARAQVASSHRQAVARVAPGARVAAHAPDGVVEALEGAGWLGVEWHPELDATAAAIYGALLRRVEARA